MDGVHSTQARVDKAHDIITLELSVDQKEVDIVALKL
jgi:hypothetical protein